MFKIKKIPGSSIKYQSFSWKGLLLLHNTGPNKQEIGLLKDRLKVNMLYYFHVVAVIVTIINNHFIFTLLFILDELFPREQVE